MTPVAMDSAARAGGQRQVGLHLAVEVEPHGQHHARAAVVEDDLGRSRVFTERSIGRRRPASISCPERGSSGWDSSGPDSSAPASASSAFPRFRGTTSRSLKLGNSIFCRVSMVTLKKISYVF